MSYLLQVQLQPQVCRATCTKIFFSQPLGPRIGDIRGSAEASVPHSAVGKLQKSPMQRELEIKAQSLIIVISIYHLNDLGFGGAAFLNEQPFN